MFLVLGGPGHLEVQDHLRPREGIFRNQINGTINLFTQLQSAKVIQWWIQRTFMWKFYLYILLLLSHPEDQPVPDRHTDQRLREDLLVPQAHCPLSGLKHITDKPKVD